ncbi:unnamed protein product [Allacma fusca]|uniref:Integrase catalytic domain-containing protein n=1 Tax=Allacma fusca TaxID=39272 RepID=A0A8J2K5X2_9HEXA|nr:unnamed protein product [Allacma fusca]
MCPDVPKGKIETDKKPIDGTALSNQIRSTEGILQTLLVRVKRIACNHVLRALLDTELQKSYLSECAAKALRPKCKDQVKIAHSLFGGGQTAVKEHRVIDIHVESLINNFSCSLSDQPVICGKISRVQNKLLLDELKMAGVELTDTGEGATDINLLFGADVLDSDRIVVVGHIYADSTYLVSSMISTDAQIADLWILDTIGIKDAVETKSSQDLEQAAMSSYLYFHHSTIRLQDGRLIGRRGRPRTIYSDNGTNFVGTANLWKQFDWEKIRNSGFGSSHSIQPITWIFKPLGAPWWGGWWEGVVRLLKEVLRKVLGRACLDFEEMLTILCDCEAVINARPLTYISDDVEDLAPLTASMLLQELREVGIPDMDNIDAHALNKRVIYRQKIREDFRRRFRIEYLGMLKPDKSRKLVGEDVKHGDIVLVGSDNTKRDRAQIISVPTETTDEDDGEIPGGKLDATNTVHKTSRAGRRIKEPNRFD